MDELNFTGKTVLVVGGSSGIGNGIARAFLCRGAKVHVAGTRPSASEYDGVDGSDLSGLVYHALDVSDPVAIDGFMPDLAKLDVLILSQGHVEYKRKEFENPGWDKVMAVNLDSIMHLSRRFKPRLACTSGTLIIISSISAFAANVGNPAYAASKAGAVSLTGSLAEAWARDGIRVNGIAPGMVATKLTAVTTSHPERSAMVLRSIPLGRFGRPDDMAGAALFLASPLAGYVTGQTLTVDGGLTLSATTFS